MELDWTHELTTGIDAIDQQHRQLFDAINRLLESCGRGVASQRVLETLSFLGGYVYEHFDTEEKLMRDVQYPEYADHKRKHDEFRRTLFDLQREVEETGAGALTVVKVNALIIHWLSTHIARHDVEMARYVHERELLASGVLV